MVKNMSFLLKNHIFKSKEIQHVQLNKIDNQLNRIILPTLPGRDNSLPISRSRPIRGLALVMKIPSSLSPPVHPDYQL